MWKKIRFGLLTQSQIALLFGTKRPAITKHLNNIFKSGELEQNSVSSILEHTAAVHDRYLIVDETVWLLGASVKDMGRGLCTVIRIGFQPEEILSKL